MSKDTWHQDRREKIGAHSKLPPRHPVMVLLTAAGVGW